MYVIILLEKSALVVAKVKELQYLNLSASLTASETQIFWHFLKNLSRAEK